MSNVIVLIIVVVAFCASIGLVIYGNDNINIMLTDDVNKIFDDENKDEIEIL